MLKGIVRDKNDSEEKKLQHNKSLRNKELTERGALTSQYIENLMKSYKKKNKNKKIKSYSQDILDKLKKYIDASLDTCQFIKSSRLDIVNGNISIDGYIFPTSLSQINPNIDNVDYSVCR